MFTLSEKKIPIRQYGGSLYLLLDNAMLDHLQVDRAEFEDTVIYSGIAMGKHGPFLYTYNKPKQREWRKTHCGDCMNSKKDCECQGGTCDK